MIETIERMLNDLERGKLTRRQFAVSSLPWPQARWQPRPRSQFHRHRRASML
jgi:hypothetical protein